MRSIFVGIEYAGKTTLINLLTEYYHRLKVPTHNDDHFTIPDASLGPESRALMVNFPDDVKERLQRMQPGPPRMLLAGAGCLSPRIVWLALRGADALQRQADEALAGLYAPEQRFMGHVTIARTRRMPDRLRRAGWLLYTSDAADDPTRVDPRG